MRRLAVVLLPLLLAACHARGPQQGHLQLSLEPPEPRPGQMLVVTARPDPKAELAWVSGTVKVMGASNIAFVRDASDGSWKFKTMIPVFVQVPPGTYEARAWGEDRQGRRYEGGLSIVVK